MLLFPLFIVPAHKQIEAKQVCCLENSTHARHFRGYHSGGPPPLPSGLFYLRCYTEGTTTRALTSATQVDYSAVTVKTCYDFCMGQHGTTLLGLKYGGECCKCLFSPTLGVAVH